MKHAKRHIIFVAGGFVLAAIGYYVSGIEIARSTELLGGYLAGCLLAFIGLVVSIIMTIGEDE